MTTETPKEKRKGCKHDSATESNDTWAEDQKGRGYYYDDAYGYEVFTGNEDEDDQPTA